MKINLNADMRHVYARLAGKQSAGMAELERLPRKEEYTGENPVTGSKSEEAEH